MCSGAKGGGWFGHDPAAVGRDRWERLLNITNATYSSSSSGSLPNTGLESVDQVVRQRHMDMMSIIGRGHCHICHLGRLRHIRVLS